MSIPKKIHYCWFGRNKMSKLALKCINSWKKHLTDYEFFIWNEDNFNINCNEFTKEAYEMGKYAFVTDYVRLYVLYNYGGLYMDTDVEVFKNLDCFLKHDFFIGCEKEDLIQTGLIAAKPKNILIKNLLDYYDDKKFILENGQLNLLPNPQIFTPIMIEKFGWDPSNYFQNLSNGIAVYPIEYFCAKDWRTGKINITENTHTIHHFSGSWHSKTYKFKNKIMRLIGKKNIGFLLNLKKKLKG